LDTRLRNEIQDAISKIGAIPFPFGNNLNAATQIQAAQQAIIKISNTLENDVKNLLSNRKISSHKPDLAQDATCLH
jgi:hypothetical protein